MNILKHLLVLLLIALFCACSNQVNKKEAVIDPANELNKQQSDSLTKMAESSIENISELPLKFSFSMSEVEVNKHIEDLIKKKLLQRIGNDYVEYLYTTKKGVKVRCILEF